MTTAVVDSPENEDTQAWWWKTGTFLKVQVRPGLLVVSILSSVAISLLPVAASASVPATQKALATADTHMQWTSCGERCVQGNDSIDSISVTIRDNYLVLSEVLSDADFKSTLEEKSIVLWKVTDGYGGQSAISWVAREMRVWMRSPAPFEASMKSDGDQFTFTGWAGDGSLALAVVFGQRGTRVLP